MNDHKHISVYGTRWKREVKVTPDVHKLVTFASVDGKPALVFDSLPTVVFVSHDGNGSFDQLFENGVEALNRKRITLESAPGEITEYHVEKYACVTEVDVLERGKRRRIRAL